MEVCGARLFRSRRQERLTVDGNGHGLSQNITVSALESWDFAQLVELLVVGGDIAWGGLDKLDVESVGLSDGEEGGGASIALRRREMLAESSFCHIEKRMLVGAREARRKWSLPPLRCLCAELRGSHRESEIL